MWAAWVVAAISVAAAAFMLRFLIALLREGAPSVCYWVVPVHPKAQEEPHYGFLSGIYVDEDCRATERDRGDYYLELENESYAKECGSGLIALDARAVSDRLGWRSIHPRVGSVFHERRP